jgi:glycosyltransferase involved in cell wall biosynthesis
MLENGTGLLERCCGMPKVSVIITTYNLSHMVGQAVESVLSQSMTDFELIIVDDGSTDNTREVINKFVDKRIKYFYKDNGGVASARNFGTKNSSGDFVAFLDDDDLWPPDYLAVMLGALEKSDDYGVAYCAPTQIYPDGRKEESFRVKNCSSGWLTRALFNKSFLWCQGTIFRASALPGFKWDESLKTCSDTDFFLRISRKTKFLFVKEVEIIRRVRKDSISVHSFSKNVNCNKIRVLERFYRQYGSEFISEREARRCLGRHCKEFAKRHRLFGMRKAAIYLFQRALSYDPYSIKAYRGLAMTLLSGKNRDKAPEWKFPEPLQPIDDQLG